MCAHKIRFKINSLIMFAKMGEFTQPVTDSQQVPNCSKFQALQLMETIHETEWFCLQALSLSGPLS